MTFLQQTFLFFSAVDFLVSAVDILFVHQYHFRISAVDFLISAVNFPDDIRSFLIPAAFSHRLARAAQDSTVVTDAYSHTHTVFMTCASYAFTCCYEYDSDMFVLLTTNKTTKDANLLSVCCEQCAGAAANK